MDRQKRIFYGVAGAFLFAIPLGLSIYSFIYGHHYAWITGFLVMPAGILLRKAFNGPPMYASPRTRSHSENWIAAAALVSLVLAFLGAAWRDVFPVVFWLPCVLGVGLFIAYLVLRFKHHFRSQTPLDASRKP